MVFIPNITTNYSIIYTNSSKFCPENFRIDRTFFSFLELDIQIIYYLSILIFKHFRILLVLWGHKGEYSAPAIIIPIEIKRHSFVHLPAIRRFF